MKLKDVVDGDMIAVVERLRQRRPATTLTWGKEIEFINPRRNRFWFPELEVLYNFHRDHSFVFEVDTPPASFPPSGEEALAMQLAEAYVVTLGYRHAEFLDDHSKLTAGSHTHFRHADPAVWARMFNWAVFLLPFALPILSLSSILSISYNAWNDETTCDTLYRPMRWRSRADYYAPPGRFINAQVITDFEAKAYADRGLEPGHGNKWYYVELNRYRKNTVTAEMRLDEQHWMASLTFLDILQALRRHAPPFLVPSTTLWVETGVTIYYSTRISANFLKDDPRFSRDMTIAELWERVYELAKYNIQLESTHEVFENRILKMKHAPYSYWVELSAKYYPETKKLAEYILSKKYAKCSGILVNRFF